MDIAFVILHYITDTDTSECIDSIIRMIDTDDYGIIVVDNASNNGSVERLIHKYKTNEQVSFVQNKKNLGFARGLNEGIKVARKLNAKFIATINNDTLIISDNFYKTIKEKYYEHHFSVAGPMIITRDDKCSSNPIRNTIRTKEEAKELIKKNKVIISLAKMHLLWVLMLKRRLMKGFVQTSSNKWYLTDQINFQLHGAFWIFSEKYFEVFDGIDDRTFLFGEESLLFLHLRMNKLISLYTPSLRIYHKEDSSTNASFSNDNKKALFVCNNSNNSLQVYMEIFDSYHTK